MPVIISVTVFGCVTCERELECHDGFSKASNEMRLPTGYLSRPLATLFKQQPTDSRNNPPTVQAHASLVDFKPEETILLIIPLKKIPGPEKKPRRIFPIPVNLKKVNLKKEIDKVLNCSLMTLWHGSCGAIKVGHTGQTIEQAVENVVSAVREITKIVPKGWNNIQSLNLKTSE
ncbi:60S ribosomal protein L10a-like [Stylophora pistillata]|uniref:60S ribosomal protein L10a-like n=1 Tax=Stylophora pistillata TaxID=50429 RepID=UPI000C03DF6D|nr:60S ribosomal protein L10a-like [Stylophora pistillata]